MTKNLLSILSHVAHGYVGNRACVFPLQCCGWDVDAVNTTDYLNHPGHGTFQGTKNDDKFIATIIGGLRRLYDLGTYYDAILVGYCPSAEVMLAVHKELRPIYSDLSAGQRRPLLVMDPVLGDNGRLYVPEEVVQVHMDFLKLGLVDLTTPNQFEMELLTGITMKSWNDIETAMRSFYDLYRVKNFVILSALIEGKMYSIGFSAAENRVFCIPIEEIKCRFSGCGDVFTALLTDEFYANHRKFTPKVLGLVLLKLHQILMTSYQLEEKKLGKKPEVVNDISLVSLRNIFEQRMEGNLEVKYL